MHENKKNIKVIPKRKFKKGKVNNKRITVRKKHHKINKKINFKKLEKNGVITRKKRMKITLFVAMLIFTCFIGRIAYIQFVKGDELKSMAYMQQTLDRKINPKRGTIYDATGKNILAVSASVETISINPVNIEKENKEKVAKILSEIFGLDYDKTLKKVSKRSAIETIAKKVEKDKANQLRKWMEDNNINKGINIDEDTKRYYPNNNLASQIIGFCGSDNQGLDGIEAVYDKELKGSYGRITKLTDAKGGDVEKSGEEYFSSIDGNSLVLTIHTTIQGIAEKYSKEACIDNVCTDGGNIVIMNPQNGDILAIAGYPDYNLNTPYEPNTGGIKETWDSLSQEEKTKNLQSMWRNKAISDTYEPGSVFKLITASAALEEGITQTDKEGEFTCTRWYRSWRS